MFTYYSGFQKNSFFCFSVYIVYFNVSAMRTGVGLGHGWGRNREFCVAVCRITTTVGILAEVG